MEQIPSWEALVKKFPAFYVTRRFITTFTRARHPSLFFWATSIQSMPAIPLPENPFYYYPPIYAWHFQVVSFPRVSPPNPCMIRSSPPYVQHASPIPFFLIPSAGTGFSWLWTCDGLLWTPQWLGCYKRRGNSPQAERISRKTCAVLLLYLQQLTV